MKTVKPGIRLKENGRYVATKSIDAKRYYKEFNTLREAEIWKNKFHPLVNKAPVKNRPLPHSSANEYKNGRDDLITVREVYEKYLNGPLKAFAAYSRYKIPKRMERFLPPILSLRMAELTPEAITELIEFNMAKVDKTYGRQSFKEELKYLKAMLNWYRSEKDFTFSVPITKYHYRGSIIDAAEPGRKHLPIEDVVRFIEQLPDSLKDMAKLQFLYALRIGEVCALTTDTIDFGQKVIHLRQSMTWLKDAPRLKESTKTGDEAELKMTPEVESILKRLNASRPVSCRFLFHQDGRAPRYRPIIEAYNKALKEIGIDDVTGSHFLRHSAATLSRKSGGIDAAQAILRHKSATMAQHYARLDFNEKASAVVIHAEKMFLEASRATIATTTKESVAKSVC